MNYKRHHTKSASKYGRCGATGKVIFRSEGGAKMRIKEILSGETNRCNGYLRAFQCHRCGFWHVTSKPNDGFYRHLQFQNQQETLNNEKRDSFQALANALDQHENT